MKVKAQSEKALDGGLLHNNAFFSIPSDELQSRWSIKKHSRFQLELTLDYLLSEHSEEKNYEIIFLIPKAIPNNSGIFDSNEFFKNVKNNVRLHSPRKIININSLTHLAKYIENESNQLVRNELKSKVIAEIKLYSNSILQQIKVISVGDKKRVKEIYSEIQNFRVELVNKITKNPMIHDDIIKGLKRSNEYISFKFIQYIKNNFKNDSELELLLNKESTYQREKFFNNWSTQSIHEKQKFLTRMSYLKKNINEVLFINSDRSKKEKFYKNLAAAVAAGLAAAINFFALQETMLAQGTRNYGFNTLFMLFLAVIIYVFKDRVKDVSKEYLSSKALSWLPDFETKISYKNGPFDNHGLGSKQEFFNYSKKEDLDDDLKYWVNKGTKSRFFHRHLIQYKIKIESKSTQTNEDFFVKDITRINFANFFSFLSDTNKNLYGLDDQGEYTEIDVKRTYPLEVLLRYSEGDKKWLGLHRVIVGRKGIERVERFGIEEDICYGCN